MSVLEQVRIADILEWYDQKKIILNPDFQRRSVWTPVARTYLIDTILRKYPIPKIYFRTKIDIETKQTIREVVDGQQRLRAIIDFSKDKFILGNRAGDLKGKKYSSLDSELKEVFLTYAIAFDQLINASDEEVLEVFARLNTYGWSLNSQEKRHAKYQGDFKWAVYNSARKWSILWDKYKIVSVRNRVRMQDDKLIAESYGVLLEGIQAGGSREINKLYKNYDHKFAQEIEMTRKLDQTLNYIIKNIADYIIDTPILQAPHFLALFSALAHVLVKIPIECELAKSISSYYELGKPLSNLDIVKNNIATLASVIDSSDQIPGFEKFWSASRSTTHGKQSRLTRFPIYFLALFPKAISN